AAGDVDFDVAVAEERARCGVVAGDPFLVVPLAVVADRDHRVEPGGTTVGGPAHRDPGAVDVRVDDQPGDHPRAVLGVEGHARVADPGERAALEDRDAGQHAVRPGRAAVG